MLKTRIAAQVARAPGARTRRSFRIDRSGVAAVEFALILPVMLLIYLGGFDIAQMVRAADKTENGSKTLADLTGQEPTTAPVQVSDIATFIQAASIAASPFNSSANLSITVSAVDLALNNNVCCTATVRWSVSQGGALRPCKTTLRQIGPNDPWAVDTIPSKIGSQTVVVAGPLKSNIYATSVIVTDVAYVYTGTAPGISKLISRQIMRHSYAVPRNAGQITLVTGSTAPTGMTLNAC